MAGPEFRNPFFIDIKADYRALLSEFDCEGKADVTQTDNRQFQIFQFQFPLHSHKDFSFRQGQRRCILDGKLRLAFKRPVDTKCRVIPQQTSLVLWSVVIGGLVKELCRFAEHDKAVGKAFRHPELFLVFRTKYLADPLTEGFRAFSEVDRDIEDFALHDTNEFTLRLLDLVVQAAQNVPGRLGMVVLHEFALETGGMLEGTGVETLEEEATVVTEDLGFEDDNFGDSGGGGDQLVFPALMLFCFIPSRAA